LECGEEGAEVLVVLLRRTGEDKDIVYIGKTEIQVFKDLVHETLEGLGGVSEAEGHKSKLEKAKGCSNCSFLDVVGVDGDLVVSPNEVDF
jgi:hypothetical protein